jgi:hypothetical protein
MRLNKGTIAVATAFALAGGGAVAQADNGNTNPGNNNGGNNGGTGNGGTGNGGGTIGGGTTPGGEGEGTARCGVRPRGFMRAASDWVIRVPLQCNRVTRGRCFGRVTVRHAFTGRLLGQSERELPVGLRGTVRVGLPGYANTRLKGRPYVRTRITLRVLDGPCRVTQSRRTVVFRPRG